MKLVDGLRLRLDPAAPDVVSVVGGGGKSSAVFRAAREAAALEKRAVVTHTARIAAFQVDWAPAMIESTSEVLPLAEIARTLDAHGWCLLTGPVVGDRRAGLAPALVDALAHQAPALGVGLISVEADGSKMRPVKAPGAHEPVLPASTTLLAPILGLDAIGGQIDDRWVHRPELVRALLGLPEGAIARLTPAQAAELLVASAGGAKAIPLGAKLFPLLNKADSLLRRLYGRMVAHQLTHRGHPALLTAVGSEQGEPVCERWGPVAVAILAAGASRRMGRPKQVEPVEGIPMILRAVQCALAAGAGAVFVVTGAQREAVETCLAPLLSQAGERLHLVHNATWEAGQAGSMRVALDALPPGVEAVIFMPADQPFLAPLLLRRLVVAWQGGAQAAAPLVEGGMRGAPALFDRRLFGMLKQVEGDIGGRELLRQLGAAVAPVAALRAWLHDVDRPEDLP